MRKHLLTTLLLGVVLAVIGFCGFYYLSTAAHREMLQADEPELAWLQREFNLSPAEFEKFSKLHASYLPRCKEMCDRIDEHNERLRTLIAVNQQMTAQVEQTLAEGARLRAECQQSMLAHFFEVSRAMKPEQAKRYLGWVYEKSFLPYYGMHSPQPAP
jgi:hypothetical protein